MASASHRGDLVVDARVTIPASDLSWTASRSGGPGGQHVNKTSTKIDLRFDLPGTEALWDAAKARMREMYAGRLDAEGKLVITNGGGRSQTANLEEARERLANLVRAALVVPKQRRKTRPSAGSKRRRLESKRRTAEKKAGRGRVERD